MNKGKRNMKIIFNFMRRLYDWVISFAAKPYALLALSVVAFAESSCFIIPPDVLLMALGLAKPKKAFFYAFVCSVFSVLGGLFGYFIGHFLWVAVKGFFIPHIFSQALFDLVSVKYNVYSFWIVFAAAFTPIPYKVFTVTAGVCSVNLVGFFVASMVGRSMRFFMVAAVFYFFGEKAKKIIDEYFGWLTLVITALLILGFYFVKRML
jgi:membrane protein YqaA with SNARE-associated domain